MARSKLNLPPPKQRFWGEITDELKDWLFRFYRRVGDGPLMIRAYNVSELPEADQWGDNDTFSSLVYVLDDAGGPTLAVSDGTNWKRASDNSTVTT